MFDFQEYATLAKQLLDTGTSEAEYRTCVSRAYYCAYILCRNRIQEVANFIPSRGDDSHKVVIDTYKFAKKNPAKAIGHHLATLKAERINSDYKVNKTIKKENALIAVRTMENIINSLEHVAEACF